MSKKKRKKRERKKARQRSRRSRSRQAVYFDDGEGLVDMHLGEGMEMPDGRTEIELRFTRTETDDLVVEGATEKDTRMLRLAFAQKWAGFDGETGIVPRSAYTLVDENGNEVDHGSGKVRGLLLKDNALMPVENHKKKPGQGAVETYLYCLERLRESGTGEASIRQVSPDADLKQGHVMVRLIWAYMRNARIFEIPKETYVAFHRTAADEIDRTFMSIGRAGPRKHRSDGMRLPSGMELGDLDILGSEVRFPGPLPFDVMYLGIGDGVQLPMELAKVRVQRLWWPRLQGVRLLGYLLVDSGPKSRLVTELCYVDLGSDNFLMPIPQYTTVPTDDGPPVGSWDVGISLAPWTVNTMIELLNSHRVIVEEHKAPIGPRRGKRSGRRRPVPPPYYTIRMRDQHIDQKASDPSTSDKARSLTYRYDRESHERCYIQRGPLPIDAATRATLEKRGYRVTTGQLSADDAERLFRRRKRQPPKRVDEWVAIKAVQIPPAVCGDKSLPYVPGVRVPQSAKARRLAAQREVPSILEPKPLDRRS